MTSESLFWHVKALKSSKHCTKVNCCWQNVNKAPGARQANEQVPVGEMMNLSGPRTLSFYAFFSTLLISFLRNELKDVAQCILKYTESYVTLLSLISTEVIHLNIFLTVPLNHISSSDNILKACFRNLLDKNRTATKQSVHTHNVIPQAKTSILIYFLSS